MTIKAAPFYNDIIKTLPLNEKGRDFVVGDIHGRYDLVDKALKTVSFDVIHDRLICVGDLIDRGPDSWKVLGFLKRPYVHAVRGNHEDFLLRIYEIESPPEELIAHYSPSMGLEWWHRVQPSIRDLIIAELRNLPLVIEMDTRRGSVGFLHAEVELGYNWGEFKTALHYQNDSVIHNALWGRKRLTRNFDVPIDGIDRLYVGHTVQTKIRQIGNIVGVDTGAVYNQHLTIANVEVSSKAIDNMTLPIGNIQVVDNTSRVLTPFSYHTTHENIESGIESGIEGDIENHIEDISNPQTTYTEHNKEHNSENVETIEKIVDATAYDAQLEAQLNALSHGIPDLKAEHNVEDMDKGIYNHNNNTEPEAQFSASQSSEATKHKKKLSDNPIYTCNIDDTDNITNITTIDNTNSDTEKSVASTPDLPPLYLDIKVGPQKEKSPAEIEAQKKVDLINQGEALAPPPLNLAKAAIVAKTLVSLKQTKSTKDIKDTKNIGAGNSVNKEDKNNNTKNTPTIPRNKLKDLFKELESSGGATVASHKSIATSRATHTQAAIANNSSTTVVPSTSTSTTTTPRNPATNITPVKARPSLDLDNLPRRQPTPIQSPKAYKPRKDKKYNQ